MKSKAISIVATILVFSLEVFGLALQGDEENQPLFLSESPLELTIVFDMYEVLNDTADNPEYQYGKLIEFDGNGTKKEYDIKLKVCGKTRRRENVCEFPPLKINFQRSTLLNTTFEGQDKLKLITHCRDAEHFQDYTMLEYQAYKIYNILTENSYRARLANVRYEDSQRSIEPITKTGFFLEDIEMVANRMNGQISEKKIWSADSCDRDAVSLMTLFEFMIGNTDWWIHTRHNVSIIEIADGSLIPIPYDFDYAGMVNAPYAVPSPILPIESVRQRFLKGLCYEKSYFQEAVDRMLQEQQRIATIIENPAVLDRKNQRSTLKYIEDFFTIIQDYASFEKYLRDSCEYYEHPENHLKYARK